MQLSPKVKIWIATETGEGAFGGGKYRLLKAIEEQGSLAAAAEKLNISYRKAWGDLKKAELFLGRQLLCKTRGGCGGGQAILTADGKTLIAAYEEFTAKVNTYLNQAYAETLHGVFDDPA